MFAIACRAPAQARAVWTDDRAIEGLPIRLVIALVVGVASLAVMMSVLGGLDGFGSTELDTRPAPELLEAGSNTTVNVTVVDPDGDPIEDATVVAKSDSASLSTIRSATTGPDGNATLRLRPTLGPNQPEGAVELDIKPPDGDYVDEQDNTDLLVLST